MPDQPPKLDPLPRPVWFVTHEPRWQFLRAAPVPPDPDAIADQFMEGTDCWIALTYIHLRRAGLDVRFAPACVPGEICVVAYKDLWPSLRPYRSFVVCAQHDRDRPFICERRICQTTWQVRDQTDTWMPHWPQPGLIPRDPSRGDTIERLTYKGLPYYLAQPFHSPEFALALSRRRVCLDIAGGSLDTHSCHWTDYSHADLVLAVRDVTIYDANLKPASKLVNAWHAGCPALLGPEHSYAALRKDPLDYLEVRSPADAIAAIERLTREPGLYRAMIEHGLARARDFTPGSIARRWRDALAGPVHEDYLAWAGRAAPFRAALDPFKFLVRTVAHKRTKARYLHNIVHGPRTLD